VRVWTTDLFRDPAQDVSRVAGLVRAASDAHCGGVPVPAPAATSQQAPAGAGRVSDATESADQRADAARTGATGATEMTDGGGTTGARASDMTEPARPAEESTSVTEPARVVRAEQTTDDTDAGWGERTDDRAHDDWLREQRPPHWG
jgi:hypothetical protein